MVKKENLLKIFIAIVILLILGAIIVPLALDPKMGLVKKKDDNSIIITDNNSEIENIEEVNETEKVQKNNN